MNRPDNYDQINAWRAGFRHGQDRGSVLPSEAEEALLALHTTIPIEDDTVLCFCNGSEAGSKGNTILYLMSLLI